MLISTSGLLADRFCEQFNLTMKPLPVAFPDSKYFVSWPKSIEKDPAVKWFRTLIEDVAKTLIPYPEP
ncbi:MULTISPECIES: hypothetical protein [Marinomonas]|uniref:LysR substrate binding domain-containing protein n=1 Tax=Marinomonas rhodophyticola TaxID=2992803 RepID=A0ABT3KFF0_9GAMM|nr:hypothetical protein [Marinomonas sp. KJ51-3]MCW4628832.1 hypothetical protein [Marinomonas sp. KJ51-3]